jgi:hypothetical protein
MIKSKAMRWTEYIGQVRGSLIHIGHYWESQKERNHLEK